MNSFFLSRNDPRFLVHSFDPLRARGAGLEGIAEILGLTGDLPVSELHDTHRIRRRTVVSKDEFGDPKVGSPEYAPDRKALFVRLQKTRGLNIASTANSLARLRVFQHRVLAIDGMLRFKIPGIRRDPMPIECRPYFLICHI